MSAFKSLAASSRPTTKTPRRAQRHIVWARRPTCKPSVDTLHCGMIKRFRHKGLEALFRTGSTKGVNADLAPKLQRALLRLNDGPLPGAMDLPSFRLHRLKGDREGVWSVWITGNYRLTFQIDGEDATNVHLEDYH
jgi:proteic killer suppression protein